jgi:histone acetyltransferase HTATIP
MPTTRSRSQKKAPVSPNLDNISVTSGESRPTSPLSIDSDSTVSPVLLNLLIPGTKLLVKKLVDGGEQLRRGEIMAVRTVPDSSGRDPITQYYVHFVEFNKRLDEWVPLDRMDLSSIEVLGSRPSSSVTSTPLQTAAMKTPASVQRKALASESTPMSQSSADDSTLMEQEIEQLRRGGSMTRRPEEISRVKNFDRIELGKYLVDTWYFSPYPEAIIKSGTVYICEFCLSFYGSKFQLIRHRVKCTLTHPPGAEIYHKDNLSFWELDGHRQKYWCRNLCMLSKLFLDHKTLFYDVDPFLFYILTENDSRGSHILGYFSKEKDSSEGYNLACILTLPQHQRKGYGRLLIEFSYELSKRQGKVGSPEKPLSDLGLLSYRSFWTEQLMRLLINARDEHNAVSIESLSAATGIAKDDVIHTLQAIDALKYRRGQYIIALTPKMIDDFSTGLKKCKISIDPKFLNWTPPQFTAADLRFL